MRKEDPLAMQSGRYTLTRKEAADALGVSVSTVRRLEFAGLNPVCDGSGTWRFDPSEVAAISPRKRKAPVRASKLARLRREGKIAARVFRLFERGADLTHVVVTVKLPPQTVQKLYDQWKRGLTEPRSRGKERDLTGP
jgi:hypothetical protein